MNAADRLGRAEVLRQVDKIEGGLETSEGDAITELLAAVDWHEQQLATLRAEIRRRLDGLARQPT